MEPLVVIILLIAAAVVLSGGSATSTPHTPAYIVVQAPIAEPASGGIGCLPWMIIGVVLLVLFFMSQVG